MICHNSEIVKNRLRIDAIQRCKLGVMTTLLIGVNCLHATGSTPITSVNFALIHCGVSITPMYRKSDLASVSQTIFALCKWTHRHYTDALDSRSCPYHHAQQASVCGQDHMAPLHGVHHSTR